MKDTDGKNFVTDDNTGGHFVAHCSECDHVFNSGVVPILHSGDSGDYQDMTCPECFAIDPPEAENIGLVWFGMLSRPR